MRQPWLSGVLTLAWLFALVLVAVDVRAGTTGQLGGRVTDSKTGAPVAGVRVSANSPSQVATTASDAGGHFVFLSLAPDTYTVSFEKPGYQPVSQPGAVVFADSEAVVNISLQPVLKVIAQVSAQQGSNLVRSGTTADVYSVSAGTQQKVSALGGGGSLKSAYSGIASAPGAVLPLNQTGYNQTVLIRGGDYNQVGYEFDGVPINRAFDNAPPGQLSSMGMRELQIYTGATPAQSQGQGLSGYVNQVMKTGTYPGTAEADLGIGTPTYFHSAAVEVGGATPDRLFSYYVGLSGYNQEFRYLDNFNAANYLWLGQVLNYAQSPTSCTGPTASSYSICYANGFGPAGYINGPYAFGFQSGIASRDVVANFHIGIPHRNDGGRDDVQLLYNSALLHNTFYSSTNDIGGPAFSTATFGGLPTWTDGFTWKGPVGSTVPLSYGFPGQIGSYYFPSSSTNRPVDSVMPFYGRDTQWNDQAIVKAQYQKNIGTSAYVRLYGYTLYSDNLQNGPMSAFLSTGAGGGFGQTSASRDYTLASHVRGASLEFSDQVDQENLVQASVNYLYSTSTRSNNTTMLNGSGSSSRLAVLVDPKNLDNGVCYVYNATTNTAMPTTCTVNAPSSTRATWIALGSPTNSVPPGTMCGPDPCAYFVAENGIHASYNAVSAAFTAGSITDQWRPNDKFLLSAGLRDDNFYFIGGNTDPSNPARQFWFDAFNHDNCIDDKTGVPIAIQPMTKCPAGTSVPQLQNISGQTFNYNVLQPRVAGTYTFDPSTVIRFSYGRYVEPPTSAEEQFNTWQENLAAYLGYNFYRYGFTTPGHAIRPMTSDNYDISYEHHFKNTDWTLKLTPFYRATQDQTQSFYLDQLSGFTAYLNVGNQTSEGIELEVDKGNFSRNGISGILAFTYTNSYIKYNTLANGTTIVTQINQDIVNYNSYTSFCASHQADPRCAGGSQTGLAKPCYTTLGAPAPTCNRGNIANPYWNAPVQSLLSSSANYPTYDLFPGPVGGSANAFSIPYNAVLILNYKHDKLAITPSIQFQGGMRYGSPETMVGVDPAAGCTRLPGSIKGDPRYPYGAPGGSPFDATTCGGTIPVPNRFTGAFDSIGGFLEPDELLMNVQVSYDVSPKLSLVGTFANIFNTCFGGSIKAWTYSGNGNICSYQVNNTFGSVPPVANVYNPGAAFQPVAKFPYGGYLGPYNPAENSTKFPFNMYFEARIKI